MKKKVAFISLNDHVPWGGSEVYWSCVAEHLLEDSNYEVAISPKYWDVSPKSIESLLSNGAIDFRRRGKIKKRTLGQRIKNKLIHKRAISSERQILTSYRPDLVVLSLGNHNSGADWMTSCAEHNLPYIIITQLVREANCPDENSRIFQMLKEGFSNAKKIFIPSFDNKHLLDKQFGETFNNVEIINNPVDLNKPPIEFPESDHAEIAMVSSLNFNHKGQDILFDVIREKKWQERDIRFNLYGNGPHEQILRRLIDIWDIKNVRFQGHTPLEEIWKRNQILLMPSRMEGLSLAFLEALSLERSAIVTNLGDTSRFIEDGVNGFMIKAPQVDFLDEALEEAWKRRDEWKDMGVLAKESLIREIDVDPIENGVNLIKEYFK